MSDERVDPTTDPVVRQRNSYLAPGRAPTLRPTGTPSAGGGGAFSGADTTGGATTPRTVPSLRGG